MESLRSINYNAQNSLNPKSKIQNPQSLTVDTPPMFNYIARLKTV